MVARRRSRRTLVCVAAAGLLVVVPSPQAAAAPFTNCDQARAAGVGALEVGDPGYSDDLDGDGDGVACELADGAGNVGTAVQVVIHKSFQEVVDPDQCIGASTLAAIRRGSSVLLSQGSFSGDTPKAAIGQFFRSRLKDGVCQVLYITSAPTLPTFNAQFVGPDGQLSSTFGPVTSQPVTDQPGNQQAVRIDMEFEPQI